MAGIGEIVALAKGLGGNGGGGSSGGVLVVHASDDDTPVLDKTWQEIKDAIDGGSVVMAITADNDVTYLATVPAQYGEDTFVVSFIISGTTDTNVYIASSANGYPAAQALGPVEFNPGGGSNNPVV